MYRASSYKEQASAQPSLEGTDVLHAKLGSGVGEAKLYLDGELQGPAEKIAKPFEWDIGQGAIRLGVNYVGLMDEVAIFRRALTAEEIASLAAAREW